MHVERLCLRNQKTKKNKKLGASSYISGEEISYLTGIKFCMLVGFQ